MNIYFAIFRIWSNQSNLQKNKEIKFRNLENDKKNKDKELSSFKNELGDLESVQYDIKARIIDIEEGSKISPYATTTKQNHR